MRFSHLRLARLALALAFLFSFSGLTFAQDVTGSIVGAVTDPSGAAVSKATVTAFSIDRQRDERTTTTDAAGNFTMPNLQIGKFRLTVEAPGFKREVRNQIVLHVNDTLTFNLALQVGAVTETVTVQVAPIQVELQSPEQSTTITGTQIRELGLVTRNYEQLVSLMPGVSMSNVSQLYVGNSLPSGQTNTIPFAINGARNSMNSWTVDGADNIDRGSNQTLLNTPSIDALAEFRVQRSGYSAEFGRAGGGQVNVVTKSGTSQFHGDLYEFVRNDAFAANNFLNNANRVNLNSSGVAAVPPLRYTISVGRLVARSSFRSSIKTRTRRSSSSHKNSAATLPTPRSLQLSPPMPRRTESSLIRSALLTPATLATQPLLRSPTSTRWLSSTSRTSSLRFPPAQAPISSPLCSGIPTTLSRNSTKSITSSARNCRSRSATFGMTSRLWNPVDYSRA